MGAGPSWYCVKISESFVRSVQQVEDDDKFVVLSYRFTVNKMIIEISTVGKTRTNERHDETSLKGEGIVDTANLNQMIFYVRSMST